MSHRAGRPALSEQPIDLDHLREQTCGDAALEADLLDLFSRQAQLILRDLAAAAPASVNRRRDADLLHTLCGSALAVGAWEVATGAERLERVTRGAVADPDDADRSSPPEELRSALDDSVERACRAIDDLRTPQDRSRPDPTRR